MNADTPRQLPYDVEVEQALLGAVMIDNSHLPKVADLEAEAFYDPLHGRMWDAIKGLAARAGRKITPITVGHMLADDAGFKEVGGRQYLVSLARSAPVLANVRDYAQILSDLASRRELIEVGENLVNSAYVVASDVTTAMVIGEHRKALERAEAGLALDDRDGYIPFNEAIGLELRKAEDALNGKKPEAILTGIDGIDRLTGGLQAQDVAIVAGRPGMGKTIALCKKTLAAARQGRPVVFFEHEMSRSQLIHRLITDWLYEKGQKAPLEFSTLRRGTITAEQLDAVAKVEFELGQLPIHIFDRAGLTVDQMMVRADRILQKAGKMGLVAVDYLQLVEGSGGYRGDRVAEVSDISKGLKRMAKRLLCPVATASQLSRRVEERPEKDRMPRMADLRESGAIEQDADIIVGLLRKVVYIERREPAKGDSKRVDWLAEVAENENKLEGDVMKNRGGPTGTFQAFIHIGAGAIREVGEGKVNEPPPALALEFGIPERRGS